MPWSFTEDETGLCRLIDETGRTTDRTTRDRWLLNQVLWGLAAMNGEDHELFQAPLDAVDEEATDKW